ncbi:hypothetical protein BDZ89DRAFT_371991 [Hymenopellis radicata]|nr:hypothetical protein BDZ89DRAFT_371991 [Hymenopellis radicata]
MTFPQELLDDIIDALARTNEPETALMSCASTGRPLLRRAQMHIFHSISLTHRRSPLRLLSLIQANDHLVPCIHKVHVDWDGGYSWREALDEGSCNDEFWTEWHPHFFNVLGQLVHLRELRLTRLSQSTMHYLLSSPSFGSLAVSDVILNDASKFSMESRDISLFLQRFPNVVMLSVRNTYPSTSSLLPDASVAPSITTLIVHNEGTTWMGLLAMKEMRHLESLVVRGTCFLARNLRAIAQNAPASLSSLSIDHLAANEYSKDIDMLMQDCAFDRLLERLVYLSISPQPWWLPEKLKHANLDKLEHISLRY